jgi:Asp-tRNA(Asn)/Glu-tRNA(Gln) amidotransferase A subunit family amidase
MKYCQLTTQWILSAMLFMGLNGCSLLPKRSAADTRDRDFVAYWPPAKNDGRLRLAVKDLIDMKGVVTTAGSEYFAKHNPPAARDAKCLEIARERNVEIVGRTNVTEFALTVSGINDYFGTPRNRVSRKRKLIPGGSSSGSAVAVANGRADVALGTDSAGSIRVPAACCGVVGLKTTYGLVPLDGVFPIAPKHLDTVGPLARDVKGVVQGMDLLQRGFAGRYDRATAARSSARSITVGRLYLPGTDPRIDQAVDNALAASGFKVVRLDRSLAKRWERADKDTKTVALSGAWIHDRGYAAKPGVSVRTRAALALGQIEYATRYKGALNRKEQWQRDLRHVFQTVDFIALPTLQQLPPRVPFFGGSPAFEARVFAMQNTAPVNLAGNPALALPIPVNEEKVRVTSLQLVGPRLSEPALLNAGRLVEAKHRKETSTPSQSAPSGSDLNSPNVSRSAAQHPTSNTQVKARVETRELRRGGTTAVGG